MNSPAEVPVLLLVDDEPAILSALRRLLRPEGYTLHLAESGHAGLELLEREKVDLVISDMRMPEMDGAQFLEQVRLRWPDITRLLLTGYADISSTIDAINRGEIYRYISKPWVDSDLMLIIRGALESARLRNENQRLLELTQKQNAELTELNASLEDKVKQRTQEIEQINDFLNLANEQLKQNFLTSIKVFSSLMELRGGAVGGHSRRVADLVLKLAQAMALTERQQQDAYQAALLHDIGKIGFSDALLSIPVSVMSSEEMRLYRRHVSTGVEALMPLEDMKETAHLIRAHHERFDGHGFPDGLTGEAIPIGARILAVINDYDALQIGTIAEKKHTPAEAQGILIQMRGTRYDPEVVDAFIKLLGEIRQGNENERLVPYLELRSGMVLSRDLLSRDGVLLLAEGYVLNPVVLKQLQDYAERETTAQEIYIQRQPAPRQNR